MLNFFNKTLNDHFGLEKTSFYLQDALKAMGFIKYYYTLSLKFWKKMNENIYKDFVQIKLYRQMNTFKSIRRVHELSANTISSHQENDFIYK